MLRIRKVRYRGHPVLGDLSIDFCDPHGEPVDTVLIAGENGVGKSAVLNSLYDMILRGNPKLGYGATVEFQGDDGQFSLEYYDQERAGDTFTYVRDGLGFDKPVTASSVSSEYPMSAIFSDVDINFHSRDITSTTSMNLDDERGSRRSSSDLPTQINQLIVDIQALDDAATSRAVDEAMGSGIRVEELRVDRRMPRFTAAFNRMFDELTYSRVVNEGGRKAILFRKGGVDIPIDALSSGEKQVVYRGCFLLKDAAAMDGAFVFIDEPEISLHPLWQMKVMEYYKAMFTDDSGSQTSQLIAVTHSPFVLHADSRRNDKVIVLRRDGRGRIVASDRPEYYRCRSIEAIEDAFSPSSLISGRPTAYLEGRTDERYFNDALDVCGIQVPFAFKWVGYIDDNGQERGSGSTGLNHMRDALISHDPQTKYACLFDCDTNHAESERKNVLELAMPRYESAAGMKKGIENALALDGIELDRFYHESEKPDDYGGWSKQRKLDKMGLCEHICSLDRGARAKVYVNLIPAIERLKKFFDA